MPRVVDHEVRRRELGAAVWRVMVRDGVACVSIRTVAAEAGWSSGALRHYFAHRAELLAFACEMVIEQVTARVASLRHGGDTPTVVREVVLQTMPADDDRHIESSIALAFLALGLGDPELARVQRLHFTSMYELCLLLVCQLDAEDLLDTTRATPETLARRLHAVVDGLTVHVLAGHLTPPAMVEQLDSYLDELVRRD